MLGGRATITPQKPCNDSAPDQGEDHSSISDNFVGRPLDIVQVNPYRSTPPGWG